jgi:3-mercaptopyruvate sulfurtransferase SseA
MEIREEAVMQQARPNTRKLALVGLGIAMVLTLGLWGCGYNPMGYDDPSGTITTTLTPSALIDAVTLKQWMDEGKVNSTDPETRDRVVVVTVASPTTYAANHIPGSVFMNSSELNATRMEAVAALTSEVPDGPTMDALISRLGIDGRTTVVFTVSAAQSNLLNATRAYFTFRYWGFPKERLKVLQAGDDGWTTAGYTLTTAVPSVAPSSFSVRSNYHGDVACLRMRTSIGQMIDVVDRVNQGSLSTSSASGISICDTRGAIDPVVGPYVANATLDTYSSYYVTTAGKSPSFAATDVMVARLATYNISAGKSMNYVYCASGHRASTHFFILDGILGWPVTLYDGSSGQWLAYRTANLVNTAWRVDTNSPNTALPRTIGTITTGTLTLDPTANALYTTVTDPRANQIFAEDKAYFTSGATASSGGGNPGGSGGPSGC